MVTQSFNERKRKKRGLLALLLLFRSRKNVALLAVVVMVLLSVAVTVPASTLYKIPGFSKFLSAIGMQVYSYEDGTRLPSGSLLELALMKRAERNALLSSSKRGDGSLYGSDRDAVSMVVGGKELWDRHATAEGRAKDAKNAVRGVGGSSSGEGSADGEDGASTDPVAIGDGVVNTSLLGGGVEGGGFGEFGTYGSYDKMRAHGAYSSIAGTRGFSSVEQVAKRVPVTGGGGSFNQAKSSGRLAGFSWNNVNATRRAGGKYAIKGRGSRRAIKQLNDVYAASMAGTRNYSMETKSVYASAPFDGQTLTLDTIGEDTGASTPSETPSFTQGQNVLDEVQTKSQACIDANSTHGRKASEIGKQIDQLADEPPTEQPTDVYNCGEINAWNTKMTKMRDLCSQYNSEASQVAAACNSTYDNNANCSSQYDPNALKCKKKPSKCAMILMLLCVFIALVLLVVVIGLIVAAAILAAGLPMWVAVAAGVLTAVLSAGVGIKALSGLWGVSMAGMGSGLGGGMGGEDTSSGS